MSARNRGFRRMMRLAIQKRRRNYWGRRDAPSRFRLAPDARMLGIVVDTPAICDCGICSNPRRSPLVKGAGRLTIQEQRAGLTIAVWEFETELLS